MQYPTVEDHGKNLVMLIVCELFNVVCYCYSKFEKFTHEIDCCSLCTTLCLQWEPEIVAVAVMYLTSRLNKFEITDWQGKPLGYRGKWYEFLVEDVTLELLEGTIFVLSYFFNH